MGKNQSASNLTNIIQYNNGNISFVSGSTTLMQISSSGAITTTGVISGSNAQSASYAINTSYLNNSGSGEFVPTGSFNTFSSSILTYTGSANSRFSSLETTSGSNISRLNSIEAKTGSYATTGSNIFVGSQTITGSILGSGSLSINGCIVSTGQIVAQTINVQQVTSSVVYSCGSNIFGCAVTDTQQMTGSVRVTGSLNTIGNACFSNIVCSCATSTIYSYFEGQNTVLPNPTERPHLFRITNGGLGISANNEGVSSQPIRMYTCGQERLTIAANGNIGIGNNNPCAAVHISNASPYIYLTDTSTAGTRPTAIIVNGDVGTCQNLTLGFACNDGTTCIINVLNVNEKGNVGIGTQTPIRKTDIISTSEQLRLAYDTSGTVYTDFRSDSAGGLLVNTSGTYMINYIGGNAKMRIDASAICFSCQVCTPGLYLGGALASSGDAAAITLKQTSTTAATGIYLERSAEQKGYYMYVGGGVDSLTFQRNNAGTKADVMALNRDGNVGIGTTAPVTTLLNGALTVWKCYNSDGAQVPSTSAQNYYGNQSALFLFGRNSGITMVGANSENIDIGFANASTTRFATIGTLTGTTSAGSDMYFRVGSDNERLRITSTGISCFSCQVCAPKMVLNGYQNTCTYYISAFFVSNSGNNTYNIAGVTTGTYTIAIAHIDWEATYAIAGNNMTIGYTVAGTRRGTNDTVWVNSCCALLSSGDAPHPAFGWSGGVLQVYVPQYDGVYVNARITTYGTGLSMCI